MAFNLAKPSEFLSAIVKQYWSMDVSFPHGREHLQRIVPSGLFEIIFYFDDLPVLADHGKSFSANALLSGHQKKHYDIVVSGNISLFAIYFHPIGLSRLLNIPLKEFYDQSIPLSYLMKAKIPKLEDQLAASGSFFERQLIVEKFLTREIQKKEKNHQLERIEASLRLINQSKGMINVQNLARASCLSRKQLERSFLDLVGATPKQFLKIIRFQNAIDMGSKMEKINFSDLAYQCGYYDQAHLINDFKSLAGYTPKQFFSQCDAFSDYFN